jgi:hypothetical protein
MPVLRMNNRPVTWPANSAADPAGRRYRCVGDGLLRCAGSRGGQLARHLSRKLATDSLEPAIRPPQSGVGAGPKPAFVRAQRLPVAAAPGRRPVLAPAVGVVVAPVGGVVPGGAGVAPGRGIGPIAASTCDASSDRRGDTGWPVPSRAGALSRSGRAARLRPGRGAAAGDPAPRRPSSLRPPAPRGCRRRDRGGLW